MALPISTERKTDLYLAASWIGAAASVLHIIALALDWPDFVKGLGIGILLVALVTLLLRKLRDEYIERLWAAGTSAAFAVVVILFLAKPFVDGAFGFLTGAPYALDVAGMTAPLALLAFFAGFHGARLRDAR